MLKIINKEKKLNRYSDTRINLQSTFKNIRVNPRGNPRLSAKQSFTLIELLVVVAIIGLLAVLTMIAINTVRQKAEDARIKADIKKLYEIAEYYHTLNGEFPIAEESQSCSGAAGIIAYQAKVTQECKCSMLGPTNCSGGPLVCPKGYNYYRWETTITYGICSGYPLTDPSGFLFIDRLPKAPDGTEYTYYGDKTYFYVEKLLSNGSTYYCVIDTTGEFWGEIISECSTY